MTRGPHIHPAVMDMFIYRHYADRRDEIITAAWDGGYTVPFIAATMGMGKATVYRLLRSKGYTVGEDLK